MALGLGVRERSRPLRQGFKISIVSKSANNAVEISKQVYPASGVRSSVTYSVFGNDGLVLLRCGYFYVNYGFCGGLSAIGPFDRQSTWTGHAVGTSPGEPVRCVRDFSAEVSASE